MTSDPARPRRRQLNVLRQWHKDHPATSQAQMAKKIGYTPSMYSMVLNGRRKFSTAQVVKCAAETEITEHDLHLIYLNHRPHYHRRRGRRARPS